MESFNGMKGVTHRHAYARVFQALGFSVDDSMDYAYGDYPNCVCIMNSLVGFVSFIK